MTRRASMFLALLLFGVTSAYAIDIRHATLRYGVDGKPLPLTVVLPKGYTSGKELPVVLALPPGSGNAAMLRGNLEEFWIWEADRRGWIVAAPEILGSSLSTTAKEVVDAIFKWMDDNISYDRARVTLAGQSNGGRGAFFAALAAAERFLNMIVMPGAYEGPAEDLQRLKGMPVWLLVGGLDERWKVLSDRAYTALKSAGAEPELEVIPGQPHAIQYEPEKLFGWIETHTRGPNR